MSASDYIVDTANEPGRICLAPNSSWPTTQSDRINAVEITFVCGYGDPPDVPYGIKSAILMTAAHLYENREATIATNLKEVPIGVESLLAPYHWGGLYLL